MTRKSKPPIAIYSALADATRCRIVEILLGGPIPVHTLAEAFSISRPAISRHLRVLKTAGLVAEVKKGRENLYALRPAKLTTATAWIGAIVSPPANTAETQPAVPAPEAVPPRKPVLSAIAVPSVEPVMSAAAPAAPAKAEKMEKPARSPKAELAINQMGFDF